MNTLVDVNNLSFYQGERQIFRSITMKVPANKIVGILGASGCGKTTLLKHITGQHVPSSGQVLYKDKNIHQLSTSDLYSIRKEMGMLFQSGALINTLTVFENVAFPLREHTRLSDNTISALVLMKLQAVGLRGVADFMPAELSGGMNRRVALARAIALDPQLVLYDEPFTGQDPISMAVLLKLIKQLNALLGITSIVVSHDVAELLSISDIVYVLADGRVVASGTPNEIQHSTDPWLRQFLDGSADGQVAFDYPATEWIKHFSQFKK